jgi:putative ABC transport system permease protein
MWSTNANTNRWGIWTAFPRFADWHRVATAFEEMAAVRFWVVNLTGSDHPEALDAVLASARLFQVLRVQPMLGRAFFPEEDQPGRDHVIILSYGLWGRRFGSDRAVIGRAINIDRQSYTVIGVMPAGFDFPLIFLLHRASTPGSRHRLIPAETSGVAITITSSRA